MCQFLLQYCLVPLLLIMRSPSADLSYVSDEDSMFCSVKITVTSHLNVSNIICKAICVPVFLSKTILNIQTV